MIYVDDILAVVDDDLFWWYYSYQLISRSWWAENIMYQDRPIVLGEMLLKIFKLMRRLWKSWNLLD